ncbi:MAG: phage holin family protein [Eubacteriaceae bacterium]|nr:phage holin family protein [Eubacteriaceae bacterium]
MGFYSLKISSLKLVDQINILAFLTFFTDLMGGWDELTKTLTLFIIIDYITGIILAMYKKELDSSVGYQGILKKSVMFLVIILANHLDLLINDNMSMFRRGVAIFYIANEGISITENIGMMGLPLPEFIRNILVQLNHDYDKKEGSGRNGK